jgi:hypothetical protein
MNWQQWLTFSPYKKLWVLIGHRPWTFIYRDVYRKYEYFIQAQWFVTGSLIYHYLGTDGVMWFWIFYTFGYLNGHFFFGSKIVDNEQGE